MASAEKMREKLLALEAKLELYGYVPSQKEDRAVYANAKYYYTNYPNNPIVARLMERFPLTRKRSEYKSFKDIDNILCEIEAALQKLGRVPESNEDKPLLAKINRLKRDFFDDKRVKRLLRIYPTRDLYPKWGPDVNPKECEHTYNTGYRLVENPYIKAYTYVKETFELYGELPGINTHPMNFAFSSLVENCYKHGPKKEALELAKYLIDSGCNSPYLLSTYYSTQMESPEMINRTRSFLKKYGVCTLGFLSKNLVPGLQLNIGALYDFFYSQESDRYRGIIKHENMHLFRVLWNYYNRDASVVVSIGINDLRELNFENIAKSIPYNILPTYNFEFSQQEEIWFAQSFLFNFIYEKIDKDNEQIKIDFSCNIVNRFDEGDRDMFFIGRHLNSF